MSTTASGSIVSGPRLYVVSKRTRRFDRFSRGQMRASGETDPAEENTRDDERWNRRRQHVAHMREEIDADNRRSKICPDQAASLSPK
ncbi:MAG: hypothetical protein R3C55_12320 [Parvularculaceae bacterium]